MEKRVLSSSGRRRPVGPGSGKTVETSGTVCPRREAFWAVAITGIWRGAADCRSLRAVFILGCEWLAWSRLGEGAGGEGASSHNGEFVDGIAETFLDVTYAGERKVS